MKEITILCSLILLISCNRQPEPRRPISHTSSTFLKESAERNIQLVAEEEAIIDSIIKSQPDKEYFASKKGYWYAYETRNETDTLRPSRGYVAFFEYDVRDLYGNLIYSVEDTRPQVYYVDKENIMMGLRDGIKLMRKNETVIFLFPSNFAYGYHGDKKDIGTNIPLKCRVTLNDIKKESEINTFN